MDNCNETVTGVNLWAKCGPLNLFRSPIASKRVHWEYKQKKPFTDAEVLKDCLVAAVNTLLDGIEKQELKEKN